MNWTNSWHVSVVKKTRVYRGKPSFITTIPVTKSLLGMIYCSCPILIHYYTLFKPISSHEYPYRKSILFVALSENTGKPLNSILICVLFKWYQMTIFQGVYGVNHRYTPIFWRHNPYPTALSHPTGQAAWSCCRTSSWVESSRRTGS